MIASKIHNKLSLLLSNKFKNNLIDSLRLAAQEYKIQDLKSRQQLNVISQQTDDTIVTFAASPIPCIIINEVEFLDFDLHNLKTQDHELYNLILDNIDEIININSITISDTDFQKLIFSLEIQDHVEPKFYHINAIPILICKTNNASDNQIINILENIIRYLIQTSLDGLQSIYGHKTNNRIFSAQELYELCLDTQKFCILLESIYKHSIYNLDTLHQHIKACLQSPEAIQNILALINNTEIQLSDIKNILEETSIGLKLSLNIIVHDQPIVAPQHKPYVTPNISLDVAVQEQITSEIINDMTGSDYSNNTPELELHSFENQHTTYITLKCSKTQVPIINENIDYQCYNNEENFNQYYNTLISVINLIIKKITAEDIEWLKETWYQLTNTQLNKPYIGLQIRPAIEFIPINNNHNLVVYKLLRGLLYKTAFTDDQTQIINFKDPYTLLYLGSINEKNILGAKIYLDIQTTRLLLENNKAKLHILAKQTYETLKKHINIIKEYIESIKQSKYVLEIIADYLNLKPADLKKILQNLRFGINMSVDFGPQPMR